MFKVSGLVQLPPKKMGTTALLGVYVEFPSMALVRVVKLWSFFGSLI